MVKLAICVKRKAGMSAPDFHRYWREVHASVVKSVPEFMRHLRKYVQSHTVSEAVPGFPAEPSQYDGLAELWFDNLEDVGKAFREPRYMEIIRPDEGKFADLAGSTLFVAEEIVMHPGKATPIKLIGALKPKAGMSVPDFHAYWKGTHGTVVKSVPEFMRHVRKYAQSHAIAGSIPGFPAGPQMFEGVAELWFDSVEEVGKAFNEPRYLEIIRADEKKFLDLAGCSIFVAEEVPIHGN
ncbi:MAG TPA: EthD domain-containing protein [Bradyrhizobium sp.]|nr:EthD domain-containing protein [Bradyrhizobium sp.]